jgi:hypothetical protein
MTLFSSESSSIGIVERTREGILQYTFDNFKLQATNDSMTLRLQAGLSTKCGHMGTSLLQKLNSCGYYVWAYNQDDFSARH